jgi:lipopolysaccharide/colanic/teichoic acid biosynthesis glycosyltransferase
LPRILEFLISLTGLILLSPLFLIIAIAIRLDSNGPVFFCSRRIGQNWKLFKIIKFRSMVENASQLGPLITTNSDNRITKIGKFLRRTKLDELPQLINVLLGYMRFVGPRPEDPNIAKQYDETLQEIFNYKPGITSPASITFRAEEQLIKSNDWQNIYVNKILPKKIKIDLQYMQNVTLFSDLKIIFQTIFVNSTNQHVAIEITTKDTMEHEENY